MSASTRHASRCLAGWLGAFIPALSIGLDARADDAPQFFNLHGQTTFIGQGNLRFNSPYSGENSLKGAGQGRETWTVTPSLGMRVWGGGELYFNPEIFQGFGLASTHGLGGYANGEAQKGGSDVPVVYTARIFLRQTFGLGGETEVIKDEFNQLAGKKDVSRLTLTVGKMAVNDIFDVNEYASDPRTRFWNWSIWQSGAFDYAADQKGYTWGAALELNQKDWALRWGYFTVPVFPNAQALDPDIFRRGQHVVEFERRYELASQPGTLKLLGWYGGAFSGSYREALANPGIDLNEAIVQTRETRIRYGFALNIAQALTKDLGSFVRVSWADGQSEIMSFTDIDASVAAGLSLKGTSWGRPDDTVGVAGAVNGLSRTHRDFIAAGGLGVLIGDGKLNYAEERIFETYYSLGLGKGVSLTFDYQFAVNPAYNADRGPVSIIGTRLHAEF